MFETTGKNKESVVVAGLAVSSGKLSRTHFFRVLRDEEVLADRLKAASMRHHKDRVNEITKDKVSEFKNRSGGMKKSGWWRGGRRQFALPQLIRNCFLWRLKRPSLCCLVLEPVWTTHHAHTSCSCKQEWKMNATKNWEV